MISVGHSEIAHVTDAEDTSTGRERLKGYLQALAAAGIPFREELVLRTTVDRIGGYRAMQQILDLERLPTAVFTVNNMTVVGAMQALRERGMAVPDDMALVCCDDVEHLAVLSPLLTVIDQPADFRKSRRAVAAGAYFRQGRQAQPAPRAPDRLDCQAIVRIEERRSDEALLTRD